MLGFVSKISISFSSSVFVSKMSKSLYMPVFVSKISESSRIVFVSKFSESLRTVFILKIDLFRNILPGSPSPQKFRNIKHRLSLEIRCLPKSPFQKIFQDHLRYFEIPFHDYSFKYFEISFRVCVSKISNYPSRSVRAAGAVVTREGVAAEEAAARRERRRPDVLQRARTPRPGGHGRPAAEEGQGHAPEVAGEGSADGRGGRAGHARRQLADRRTAGTLARDT